MSEFYDRDKFTGGQKPPQRPPQKKPDNTGWYSWPAIIVLFAIGLWPVALFLMLKNIFGSAAASGQRKPSAEARMETAVEDAVERAMAKAAEKRAGTRPTAAQESMEKRRGATAGAPYTTVNERVVESEKRAQEAIDRAKAKAAQSSKTTADKPEKKKKQKLPGKLLRVIGICLLVIGMIASVDSAANLLQGWSYYLEDLFAGLGFMAAGGIMWGRGQYLAHMTRRSQRYILAIGNVDVMSLSEIAKRVNRTPEKAAKELQKLIDKGYLGEDAYIDHERGYFLRFGATLEEDKPKAEEPAASVPQEAEEGYSGILRNIRRANDRIADEELSRKIDRLEQISGMIFKEVEEHPEKRSRIRTFFDYYLPTTQKLLDAYADFEETGVEGEHLRQAKERIEQTMDAIVEGFEHQLDQLYSSDAMDVVSDIKVMETMLGRDIASAAKDFGYDQAKDDSDGIQLEL